MNHQQKRHLAARMRTRAEIAQGEDHESLFDSKGWEARHNAIQKRHTDNQNASHARAVARRTLKTPKTVAKWRVALHKRLEASRAQRSAKKAAYKAKRATV